MPKIFHILQNGEPFNDSVKVHFRLAEIEKELGYESYIAFLTFENPPSWFSYSCPVIDAGEIEDMISKNDILICEENPEALHMFDNSAILKRICYIQDDTKYLGDDCYKNAGVSLWFNSRWNSVASKIKGDVIHPFVDTDLFTFSPRYFAGDKITILGLRKQGGQNAWKHVYPHFPILSEGHYDMSFFYGNSEKEFAKALCGSHAFFTHITPLGFGLPLLEAMATGTLVFGYHGGGSLEFAKNGENCMVVGDGPIKRIASSLLRFTALPVTDKEILIAAGLHTARQFNRNSTKEQLIKALEKLNATI